MSWEPIGIAVTLIVTDLEKRRLETASSASHAPSQTPAAKGLPVRPCRERPYRGRGSFPLPAVQPDLFSEER
jgi:hypothetical protein